MRFGAHRQLIRKFRAKQAARGACSDKGPVANGPDVIDQPRVRQPVEPTLPGESMRRDPSCSPQGVESKERDGHGSSLIARRPLQEVALDAGTAAGESRELGVACTALKSSGAKVQIQEADSSGSLGTQAGLSTTTMTSRLNCMLHRFVSSPVGDWWRSRWNAHRAKLSEAGAILLRGLFFAAWFTPAVFFVAIGVCTLIAPQLVATAVAAFFVFLGLGFFALAIKFIQFKRKVERVARSFEARLVVQGVPLEKVADMQERRQGREADTNERLTEIRIPGSSKKILFH